MPHTGRDLTGRNALVTGGTRGIGEETARALAERGAAVTIVGRDEARGRTAAAALREASGNPVVSFLPTAHVRFLRWLLRPLLARLLTPGRAATSSVVAATSPELAERTGLLLDRGGRPARPPTTPSRTSRSPVRWTSSAGASSDLPTRTLRLGLCGCFTRGAVGSTRPGGDRQTGRRSRGPRVPAACETPTFRRRKDWVMPERCDWAAGDPLLLAYHDEEWGVPSHDDRHLFGMLTLGGAQAGLSWSTILKKRDGYRRAFAGFEPAEVARFDEGTVDCLLHDPGIVRNRMKIESAIGNARETLVVQEEFGSLDVHLWGFVDGSPRQNRWRSMQEIPAQTRESAAMSKDLKRRGFRFVGPTICYAFMQAVGLVNDHITSCFRYRQLRSDAGRPSHSPAAPPSR